MLASTAVTSVAKKYKERLKKYSRNHEALCKKRDWWKHCRNPGAKRAATMFLDCQDERFCGGVVAHLGWATVYSLCMLLLGAEDVPEVG
jgi:hypothetical protein